MGYSHNFHDFGPFRLDVNEKVLLRAGRRVPLPAKAVSTLIVLVRSKGRVVDKDELMEEVWPNEVVEEANLAQHIFMLRRAFGDTAENPQYIETVPRRGYRFLRVVKETDDSSAAAEHTVVSRHIHSLAVLPFTADPQTEHLADSTTESVINRLSQLPGLRVRPKSAVLRYKNEEFGAQQLGDELGVHSVVIGNVHLVDHTLTISMELVDVAGGWQVWGRTYSTKLSEILSVQEEIAKDVKNALLRESSEDKHQHIERFTENQRSYQAYIKGRHCWCKHTKEGLEQAIEYFRQAFELDPGYALAYAAIVDCYLRLATNYFPPTDALPSSAVASGVNSLEDSTPQTLAALRLRYEWDLKSAEREVKRAVELKSNYPAAHQWNAVYLLCRKLSLDALDLSRTEENPAATQRGASMLEPSLADQFNSTSLTPAEELQVVCLVAREQIAAGNPEAACLVLQRWYCLGQWPSLEGLSSQCSADLLFTAGKLAGHVGIRRQVPRAQKHAEALLNGAIGIFEQLGLKRQSAEGQMELGVCYWREGLFDLARTTFLAADNELKVHDDELRGRALLLLAMNEFSAGRLHDALARLKEVSTIIETTGPWLTAIYNHQLALIFRNLSIAENASDYFERALNHYIDALDQFEAVGNYESAAYTENNCGYLLLTHNYLTAAETHLMRARKLFEITNRIVPGQFEDTRARFYVAAEQFDLAEQAIARSITTLEKSGEEAGLAESLITKGILLCRAGRYRKAKRVLEHARQIAERCDDRKGVVHALLTLIEELWLQLEDDERVELRATLDQMLAEAQETSTIERFRKCLGLIA